MGCNKPGDSHSSSVNMFLKLDPPIWEESREKGSPPVRWSEFTDAFIDHFLPAETKAARAAVFESLKQRSMNVCEYHMEFGRLPKYAIHMLPTMEAGVRRKMVGFPQATENRKLKNRMEHEGSSKARSTGNFGGSSSCSGGRSAFRGGSSRPCWSFTHPSMREQPSGLSQQ
ncbi:uncharacterized protein [Nicotiana tomentosiformis]|uniref:uncharacterized protein n=1 Tax=Nicotiana tomentosiformis TaxID=4098 RepID=UPI00388CE01B